MKDIQKNYGEARHNIEQVQIAGSGSTINRVWYYIVPQAEREKVQARLKEHLNLQ